MAGRRTNITQRFSGRKEVKGLAKGKRKIAGLLAGLICLAGISGTIAVYGGSISITNPFSTSASSAVLVESYNPASTFLPGETVEKKPYFKNTGEQDLVLRVRTVEEWTPKQLDTEMVEKGWTESWKSDWVRIGDYFYYRKVLKKAGHGEDTTPVILNYLKLKAEDNVTNDFHVLPDYSGGIYELRFEAQAIPATAASVTSLWWDLKDQAESDSLEWKGLLQQQYK